MAVGIQLHSFVLTPTPQDSSKHQSVNGNKRVGEKCVFVCSLFVQMHLVLYMYVRSQCGLEAPTLTLSLFGVSLTPGKPCRKLEK